MTPQGELVQNFLEEADRQLQALSEPSPAGTTSLAIAETICERARRYLNSPAF